jgi:phosphoketolase
MQEPGRFRPPRDAREAAQLTPPTQRRQLFHPEIGHRLFISHTRPETMAGVLRPLDTGPQASHFLGYRNHGGTLDTGGMLFANACSWGHIVAEAARLLQLDPGLLLDSAELQAVLGRGDPYVLIPKPHHPG